MTAPIAHSRPQHCGAILLCRCPQNAWFSGTLSHASMPLWHSLWQGHSVLDFPIASQGFRPPSPLGVGKAGMGGPPPPRMLSDLLFSASREPSRTCRRQTLWGGRVMAWGNSACRSRLWPCGGFLVGWYRQPGSGLSAAPKPARYFLPPHTRAGTSPSSPCSLAGSRSPGCRNKCVASTYTPREAGAARVEPGRWGALPVRTAC